MEGTLFDINEVAERLKIKRNADGSLKAQDLKAVQWYMLDRGLKPKAASAFPIIYFNKPDGSEVQVNIVDIKEEYRAFKAASRRKKTAA
ncbi:hypothetical protein AB0H71_29030 [Nocardia sp. NPDC050697]|uniref:hypothetical protein n=1 Tax=Nocardia sp. NPDC050697 TaxID=3155158 RepID=UPI0033D5AFD5